MMQKILDAAVKIAESMPLHAVTRGRIAKKAKVAPSLVSFYLGTMDELREKIVAQAIETNNVTVVSWALAARHPGIEKAPIALRRDALKLIARS